MIYRDEATGKCPVKLEDPQNPGEFINTCYEKGQTYHDQFGDISTSYEECRADLSGMFLSFFPEVDTTFGWSDKNKTDLLFLVYNNEFSQGYWDSGPGYLTPDHTASNTKFTPYRARSWRLH